ncbi:hypothetical protein EMIT07CA2_50153 [Brevibacillus sp. IT-7CA2]
MLIHTEVLGQICQWLPKVYGTHFYVVHALFTKWLSTFEKWLNEMKRRQSCLPIFWRRMF